jgi:hypothetical protein
VIQHRASTRPGSSSTAAGATARLAAAGWTDHQELFEPRDQELPESVRGPIGVVAGWWQVGQEAIAPPYRDHPTISQTPILEVYDDLQRTVP